MPTSRMTQCVVPWAAGAMALLLAAAGPPPAATADDDARPLSPAQRALFETPHLRNVDRAETLEYGFVRDGAAGFADTVAVHVRKVNPDGTKDLAFDYLTGARRVALPELDGFRGNPLLMVALERDVTEMKEQLGLSTSYFRNRIREAFVTGATVQDATFRLDGKDVPAQAIRVQPFAGDQRLERLAQVQAKTYTFLLSDAVPGTLAEIRIDMPADAAMQAPPFEQRITFKGVEP